MKTAILVDGGYYRKRAFSIAGDITAKERAEELYSYCKRHLWEKKNKTAFFEHELYRIFYYDCPPSSKKVYHPLLKRTVDLGKTDIYSWSNEFVEELSKKRKVALRMGTLSDALAHYNLKKETVKMLLNGKKRIEDLTENDFSILIDQKGVDMKIGLDIASLAYKKQVDQIVLISGDSDFVPASKLARREGIDFILDSLGEKVKDDLSLHIDGLKTHIDSLKPINKTQLLTTDL